MDIKNILGNASKFGSSLSSKVKSLNKNSKYEIWEESGELKGLILKDATLSETLKFIEKRYGLDIKEIKSEGLKNEKK